MSWGTFLIRHLSLLQANNADPDQTAREQKLILIYAIRICHEVDFSIVCEPGTTNLLIIFNMVFKISTTYNTSEGESDRYHGISACLQGRETVLLM